MINFSSINSRIIIGAISLVSIFMLFTAYSLNKIFYDSAYASVEERLVGQIYLLMADRELTPSNLKEAPQSLQVDIIQIMDSKLSAYVTQADGTILWQSRTAQSSFKPPIVKLEHGQQYFKQYEANGISYLSLSIVIFWDLKNKSFPLVYHLIDDLSLLKQQASQYRQDLWAQMLLMSITLLLTLFFILRWGLKPLREVVLEIKAVEQGEQERLKKDYPIELTPLTQNINQLIQFERQQQLRYRNALADLAHSLKTPLAIIKNHSLNTNDPNQYMENINHSVQQMNSIVEYQLQRATSAGLTAHIQYLHLSPIVHSLINSMKKIYRNKEILFKLEIDKALQFKIDKGDFMEILGNILDNACKWCHSEVALTIYGSQQQLSIELSDDGPGIAADKIDKISSRGFRADQLVPGHGVGLAIVKEAVDYYQGTIIFSSPDASDSLNSRDNRGLTIKIQLNC